MSTPQVTDVTSSVIDLEAATRASVNATETPTAVIQGIKPLPSPSAITDGEAGALDRTDKAPSESGDEPEKASTATSLTNVQVASQGDDHQEADDLAVAQLTQLPGSPHPSSPSHSTTGSALHTHQELESAAQHLAREPTLDQMPSLLEVNAGSEGSEGAGDTSDTRSDKDDEEETDTSSRYLDRVRSFAGTALHDWIRPGVRNVVSWMSNNGPSILSDLNTVAGHTIGWVSRRGVSASNWMLSNNMGDTEIPLNGPVCVSWHGGKEKGNGTVRLLSTEDTKDGLGMLLLTKVDTATKMSDDFRPSGYRRHATRHRGKGIRSTAVSSSGSEAVAH